MIEYKNEKCSRGGARVIVLIIVVAVLVIAGLIVSRPAAVTKPAEERVWHVRAATVAIGSQRPTVFLLGKVESPDNAQLSSAIEADVLAVNVKAGQAVEVGAELIRLDDREARERLRQREAELNEVDAQIKSENARHESDLAALDQEETLAKLSNDAVERIKTLETRELSSRNQLDEALQAKARQNLSLLARQLSIAEHPARLSQLQARRAQALARLNLARIEMDRTVVIAPQAVVVAGVDVAPGQRVRVGDKLLSVFPRAGIEVRGQIPARHLAPVREALRRGQEITGRARLDGEILPVKLARLAAQVESGSAGVDAFLRVDADTASLQLGRIVEVLIELPAVDGVFGAPRESLYGMERVYKIIDGRLVAADVDVVGDQAAWDEAGGLLLRGEGFVDGDLLLATKFANAMEGLAVVVDETKP